MALSGSQLAYKDARAGRSRAGASRTNNYALVNAILIVNGTDRTAYLQFETLSINQVIGEEPDTCRFSLLPTVPFTPTAGHDIKVSLGSASNVIFGGQIIRATARYVYGISTNTPWWDIECTDHSARANKLLVTAEYTNTSATDIAVDLVDRFGAANGFTRHGVASGLPTLSSFQLTNETLTGALRRLANAIGGNFYWDGYKDLHLFASTGDASPGAGTNPLQLTASRRTTKSFQFDRDVSQIRTRVIVEGQRTTVPVLAVPAGVDSIPLTDVSGWSLGVPGVARFGTQRITYAFALSAAIDTSWQTGLNPGGSVLHADVAPGATSVIIENTPPFQVSGWYSVGGQVFRAISNDLGVPYMTLGVPASGFGAIQGTLKAGEPVIPLPYLVSIPTSGVGAILVSQPPGAEVVLRAEVDDAAAQATLAAIEGGDGVHEYFVEDGRYNYDGALARANAETALFKAQLTTGTWETEDMNARAGRQLSVSLASLAATLTIIRSELVFHRKNYFPRRRCELGPVKLATILDAIVLKP